MTHIQTEPAKQKYWEHLNFSGVREGTLGDENPKRKIVVSYAPFASEADALARESPGSPHCHLEIGPSLVDRFFWENWEWLTDRLDALEATALTTAQQDLIDEIRAAKPDAGYTMSEERIGGYLHWYLTGNPTESELAQCPDMGRNRSNMLGTPMFSGAFTVTQLPEERDS